MRHIFHSKLQPNLVQVAGTKRLIMQAKTQFNQFLDSDAMQFDRQIKLRYQTRDGLKQITDTLIKLDFDDVSVLYKLELAISSDLPISDETYQTTSKIQLDKYLANLLNDLKTRYNSTISETNKSWSSKHGTITKKVITLVGDVTAKITIFVEPNNDFAYINHVKQHNIF